MASIGNVKCDWQTCKSFLEMIKKKKDVLCSLGVSVFTVLHRWGNERSVNKDGENGSEIFRGGDRMGIAWPLACI